MNLLSINLALRSLIKIPNAPAISVQILLARGRLILTKILKMRTKFGLFITVLHAVEGELFSYMQEATKLRVYRGDGEVGRRRRGSHNTMV